MMENKLMIDAYAKINLTLDVTGRLPNGYHTVEMIMQSVKLCDRVTLKTDDSGLVRMVCDRTDLSAGEDNLAVRAARLFLSTCGREDVGVAIELEKNIPMQAGMAGGSTDAAAVLTGLNRLLDQGLSVQELCEMGLKLGADVPYCIRGGTMLAEGIGEVLTPVAEMPPCPVVVCKPPVGVPTPEIYRAIDAVPIVAHPQTERMLAALRSRDLEQIGALLCNVMEPVTAERHPVIYEIKRTMLAHGALGALMSGSGSAVFGLFRSREAAKRAYAILSQQFSETFLTETV